MMSEVHTGNRWEGMDESDTGLLFDTNNEHTLF